MEYYLRKCFYKASCSQYKKPYINNAYILRMVLE